MSDDSNPNRSKTSPLGMSYKDAGVDIEAGDALVDWLQADQKPMPHADRIVGGIGGFASLFRLPFEKYKKPLVITCTDGVGTKVKLASHFKDYSTVGQDLVAMCVNDLICTGGDPYLFLDYYATGKLDQSAARPFLESVKNACRNSDTALVGGETAEMPGVYRDNDFDCAGFAVGLVDEEKTWGAHLVKDGDRIFGLSSSGFHSNGYSLVRKVFAEDLENWKDVLLRPTALYVQVVKALREKIEIHAAAHITGGGIENIPRVLPEGAKYTIKDWEWPEPFCELQRRTGLSKEQMLITLNCGLGFCVIAPASGWSLFEKTAKDFGFKAMDLGEVRL